MNRRLVWTVLALVVAAAAVVSARTCGGRGAETSPGSPSAPPARTVDAVGPTPRAARPAAAVPATADPATPAAAHPIDAARGAVPARPRHVLVTAGPDGRRATFLEFRALGGATSRVPLDAAGDVVLPPPPAGLRAWSYVRAVGQGGVVTPWASLFEDADDVSLVPDTGAALTGRVLDAGTSDPIAGAEVEVREGLVNRGGVPNGMDERVAVAVTDGAGAFAAVVARGRPAIVVVRAEGHARAERTAQVPATGDVAPIEIALAAGGAVTGIVRRPDGVPASGARVLLVPESNWLDDAALDVWGPVTDDDASRRTATAGADGAFRVVGVPFDVAWVARAWADGFAWSLPSAALRVTPDEPTAHVEITVRAGARIDFLVRDAEGAPVGGATVLRMDDRWLFPRADEVEPGRYRFARVVPGGVTVAVTAPGFAPASASADLRDGETREVVVALAAPVAIGGTVVDDRGAPVPGACVRADPLELGDRIVFRSDSHQATADDRGAFVVGGLAAGRYDVGVLDFDVEDDPAAPCVVTAPATDVVLRVRRLGAVVFRLRLPPGSAAPATVRYDGDLGGGAWNWAPVLRKTHVPAGHHVWRVRAEGFASVRLEFDVRPGEDTDLGEIALVAAPPFRARVVDPEGRPVAGAVARRWQDGAPAAVRTGADGVFVLPTVDPADDLVTVRADGFAEERVRLDGAAPRPSEIRLRRGMLVRVAHVDAAGHAVSGGLLRALPEGAADDDGAALRWIELDVGGHGEVRLPAGRWRIGDPPGTPWRIVDAVEGGSADVSIANE